MYTMYFIFRKYNKKLESRLMVRQEKASNEPEQTIKTLNSVKGSDNNNILRIL